MIIKIFKIPTKEMYTFKNKSELITFVRDAVGTLPANITIDNLIKLLPRKDYYRLPKKRGE